MEKQVDKSCPYCLSADIKIHRIYTTVNNGNRTLYEGMGFYGQQVAFWDQQKVPSASG